MAKKTNIPTKTNYKTFADGVGYVLHNLGSISLLSVFRTMLIILNIMVLIFLYNVVTSQQSVEKIIDSIVETEVEEDITMNIRDQVGPQIMRNLNKMLYSLDADRAFVIELHNGKKNATKMPFKFFDMTYEEVNDERGMPYISDNFGEVLVSHYKLPFWLGDNFKFIGNTDELSEIDGRFASNMEKFGSKYIGIMLLKTKKQNLGFIGITYTDEKHAKDTEEINHKLTEYASIITPLLDLTVQKAKYKVITQEQ